MTDKEFRKLKRGDLLELLLAENRENTELSRALDRVDFDTWEGVDDAAEYVQKVIYENTDFRGTGDVALVGHSHLDIAYYWRRIHAVQKNARTTTGLAL